MPRTMQETISIIVPAYNEELVLRPFLQRLSATLATLPGYDWEILFVNDGSTDTTQQIIEALCAADPRVGGIELSRNFGKEPAMTAGLDHARGDAIVILDADLQDPPELIADFVREWKNGHDVVVARRTHRDGETWIKKLTAHGFYRVIGAMSKVDIPANTGDCRLMSRRAVDSLLRMREHHRFMKGLFAWVGYPTKVVDYRREPRAAGTTKFNYWKLWNFAIEGITSFSIFPLKLATYFGVLIALAAFVAGAWIVLKTLVWGEDVPGYPSLMVTMLFLGGVQLFFIGILGEYLGRIYNETKQRPLYLVQSYSAARTAETASQHAAPADRVAQGPMGAVTPRTPTVPVP